MNCMRCTYKPRANIISTSRERCNTNVTICCFVGSKHAVSHLGYVFMLLQFAFYWCHRTAKILDNLLQLHNLVILYCRNWLHTTLTSTLQAVVPQTTIWKIVSLELFVHRDDNSNMLQQSAQYKILYCKYYLFSTTYSSLSQVIHHFVRCALMNDTIKLEFGTLIRLYNGFFMVSHILNPSSDVNILICCEKRIKPLVVCLFSQ